MATNVSDLIHYKILKGTTLAAGEKGLSRQVTGVGILDYELDFILENKFKHDHFYKGQFVLSTFVYARDNEHLINEAIQYLVKKEASGLLIKNVYNLPFHNYIIKYAESMNFPLFIVENSNVFFEDLIVNIHSIVQWNEEKDYNTAEIEALWRQNLSPQEVEETALKINPSMSPHYFILYVYRLTKPRMVEDEIYTYKQSDLNKYTNILIPYKGGYVFIYSQRDIKEDQRNALADSLLQALSIDEKDVVIGGSRVHYNFSTFKNALQEAIYASLYGKIMQLNKSLYDNIGSYQLLFPASSKDYAKAYYEGVLEKIIDYDAQNAAWLEDSLRTYIFCGGNIARVAENLGLHENTVRNRLERVYEITGLNVRNLSPFEEISIAIKLKASAEELERFNKI